jgi:hypothetical protein
LQQQGNGQQTTGKEYAGLDLQAVVPSCAALGLDRHRGESPAAAPIQFGQIRIAAKALSRHPGGRTNVSQRTPVKFLQQDQRKLAPDWCNKIKDLAPKLVLAN